MVHDSSRLVERMDDSAIEPDDLVRQANDAVNDWQNAVREAKDARANYRPHKNVGRRVETYLNELLCSMLEDTRNYRQVRTPGYETESRAAHRDAVKKRAKHELDRLTGMAEDVPDVMERMEYKSRLLKGYSRFEEELGNIDVDTAPVEFLRPVASCCS